MLALAPLALVAQSQLVELDQLASPAPAADAWFGAGVALSPDTAMVGATGVGSGSVDVYVEAPFGTWTWSQALAPAGVEAFDGFGRAIAIDGDRALVGAPGDDDAAFGAGAVYVFERVGGLWTEVDKLAPAGAVSSEEFGAAVDLDGDVAVIGAPGAGFDIFLFGAAYVFERQPDGTWVEALRVIGDENNRYGTSVALADGVAFVGAPEPFFVPGKIDRYERQPDGSWLEVQGVAPPFGQGGERFGTSMSLNGDRLLVGAPGDDGEGFDAGSAHVFELVAGAWQSVARLTATTPTTTESVGQDVALLGDRAFVGAPGAPGGGVVRVFERQPGGAWDEGEPLAPSAASTGALDFASFAVHGSRLIVGAAFDSAVAPNAGSAWTFETEPLGASPATISVSGGGFQVWDLFGGHLHPGALYVVLGSATGTSPGLPLGPGLELPLVVDAYFTYSLVAPNAPPYASSLGFLDGDARAAAAFAIGPGSNPAWAGLVLRHAFALLDPGAGAVVATSNAVPLTFVP